MFELISYIIMALPFIVMLIYAIYARATKYNIRIQSYDGLKEGLDLSAREDGKIMRISVFMPIANCVGQIDVNAKNLEQIAKAKNKLENWASRITENTIRSTLRMKQIKGEDIS